MRLTRYEGASPDAIDEALETKKRVLPTEPGQTEGMKGAIFLTDADSGTVVVLSLWEDKEALEASEGEAARLRDEVTSEGESARSSGMRCRSSPSSNRRRARSSPSNPR